MAKINDLIANFKEKLNEGLSKDSSAEDIKKVDGLKAQLDEIENEANITLKEKADVTEMYIKSMKNQGSEDKPKDENKEPRSLEEIAKDVVEQDKK